MLRTREEARALIEKIEQKVQEGLSIKAACTAMGLKDSYYHSWRRRHKGKSFKKKTVPTLLSLPIPSSPSSFTENKLMVLVGSPQDIRQTLDQLITLSRASL